MKRTHIRMFCLMLSLTMLLFLNPLAALAAKPAAPSPTASSNASTGKPKITWDDVKSAEEYQIYRASSSKGEYKKIKTTSSTSYTDKSAEAGKLYYYKVRAIGKDGAKSSYSDVVKRTCDLPKPTITVEEINGSIKIKWSKIEDAQSYNVYRSTSKNGTYKKLAVVQKDYRHHTDMHSRSGLIAGETYYYKVKAIHANSSANSAYSSVQSMNTRIGYPHMAISSVSSTGAIKLEWKPVDNAIEYTIYRKVSPHGEYKLFATTTKTSLVDTDVVPGTIYYYKAKSIHKNPNANSVFSDVDYRTCDLPKPQLKESSVASSGKIKLTWNAIAGAKEYAVYRKAGKSGEYKLFATTTKTTLTDNSAVPGTVYYYKAKAVHENPNATSSYSSAVYQTCDLARPSVSIQLSGEGKPVLSWNAIEDAECYQVYRAGASGSDYRMISSISDTSYTDLSADAGTTYSYKVKAVHKNTNANSAYSSVDTITAE